MRGPGGNAPEAAAFFTLGGADWLYAQFPTLPALAALVRDPSNAAPVLRSRKVSSIGAALWFGTILADGWVIARMPSVNASSILAICLGGTFAILARVVASTPLSLALVSPVVARVVRGCMAREPNARHASFHEVLEALSE